MLRTLGGRNIGKCRLRAHQHPPLPPLSNLPALSLLQAGESSLQQRPLQAGYSPLRQRRIESDAYRCCGRDRCHSGGFLLRIMPPSWHPVPACASQRCCRRAIQQRQLQAGDSSSPQRKLESDADLVAATTTAGGTIPHCSGDGAATILKSGPKIKNRCTQEGLNREKLASIPKSEPEIKNRCTKEDLNREKLASIPKSGPKIKNRCTKEGLNREKLASIPKSRLEIKNR